MKFKLLFLIFLPWSIAFAMEAPENICTDLPIKEFIYKFAPSEEIIASAIVKAEQKKFGLYKKDNYAKFLEKLENHAKRTIGFVENNYLHFLQATLEILMFQHLLMQAIIEFNYYTEFFNFNDEQKDKILSKTDHFIAPSKDKNFAEGRHIRFHSPEALNALLNQSEKYKRTQYESVLSADIQEFLIALLLSNNEELKNFAELKLRLHITIVNKDLIYKAAQKVAGFNNSTMKLVVDHQQCQLVKDNSNFLSRTYEKLWDYIGKTNKSLEHNFAFHSIQKDLNKYFNLIAQQYVIVYPHYKELYGILKTKLNSVIKDKMLANKNNPNILKSLLSFNIDTYTHTMLPAEMPDLIDPSKHNPVFSFTAEIKEAMKKNIKIEIAKPVTIQRIKKVSKKRRRLQHLKKVEIQNLKAEPICLAGPPIDKENMTPNKENQLTNDKNIVEDIIETDKKITIYNPENETLEVIFKTDKPFAIKETLIPNYTDWVNQWLEDPEQALIDQNYKTVGHKKYTPEDQEWKPIVLHAFSQTVDCFLQQWGTKSTIASRSCHGKMDTLLTLPGMITYPNGKSETGIFTYIIDSQNGQWYHRMFEPQSTQKLMKDLLEKGYFTPSMQGYYDVAFPAL